MSTKLVLVPHKNNSGSVKRLANSLTNKLGFKVFRVRPERVRRRIPFIIGKGTDKLTQLTVFKEKGISCPEYTTDKEVAREWLREESLVVCRTLLRSCEGKGIVLASTEEELVTAPLYTRYVPKKREYRVHVLHGNVIDVQEKRKKSGFSQDRNTRIRNTANGYVFCREGLVEPTGIRELALSAVSALNYPLGAVDIVYNEHYNRLVVLEVNSNPGLEGTTLEKYASSIAAWYKEKKNALRLL